MAGPLIIVIANLIVNPFFTSLIKLSKTWAVPVNSTTVKQLTLQSIQIAGHKLVAKFKKRKIPEERRGYKEIPQY